VADHVVTSIEPGQVSGRQFSVDDEPVTWHTDAVVLVTQRVSEDSLYHALRADPDRLAREGISGLFRIGDCVEPRLIADSIFDGHRLAREIDSDDPANPLPFVRENVVLSAAELRGPAMTGV
jgi:dimethylamine/trimethylamine dehydrogenase